MNDGIEICVRWICDGAENLMIRKDGIELFDSPGFTRVEQS